MEDLIDEMFSSIDEYYPGSRRKRKVTTDVDTKIPEIKTWDSRSYKKPLNGEDVEFFTLGALADALGRPVVTIRDWMKKGYLPSAPYRLPEKADKYGEVRKGRRLYSRSMIESAIEIFDKHGLLHLNKIEWSNHKKVSNELSEAWDRLRANAK